MSQLRNAIQQEISIASRGVTKPMQGIILPNKIDVKLRVATEVIIPAPGVGMVGEGSVDSHVPGTPNASPIILRNVPLPAPDPGVIESTGALDNGRQRACLVGFRGDNLSFPYIINFIDVPCPDPNATNTSERSSATGSRFSTAGGPGAPAAPAGAGIPPASPGRSTPTGAGRAPDRNTIDRMASATPSATARRSTEGSFRDATLTRLASAHAEILRRTRGEHSRLSPPAALQSADPTAAPPTMIRQQIATAPPPSTLGIDSLNLS